MDTELHRPYVDDLTIKCPECGKKKLKRLVGGGLGIIFKGNGFYVTDNKNSKNSSSSSSESKSGSKTTAKKENSDSNSSPKPDKKHNVS